MKTGSTSGFVIVVDESGLFHYPPPMFTVFMCRKCEHLLYVEEDENFPQKLGKIAAKACPRCGEQDEGLWRLLGRAEGFEGTIFVEEQDDE